jgi:Spy/CpxP family protein refolding chaperone
MQRVRFGLAALTFSAGLIMACSAQQPSSRKGSPPEWNPVHVFPPDVRDSLHLTEEQEKQIDDLEREIRGRIDKILTAQQRRILSEARPRRGPGGPGGPGGPPDGPGGRPGRGGQRPGGPDRPGGPGGPPPGGPDDFEGPPQPNGPREWEEAIDSLNLSDRQREKSDDIIDLIRDKLHKQHEQAHADLLRQIKMVLNDRQFQEFQKGLRWPTAVE